MIRSIVVRNVIALALALACPAAWSGTPVRVATNPGFGGVVLSGILLYPGGATASGIELWRTDGTIAGTALVKDLLPDSASSYPANFVAAGGFAYFTTTISEFVYALWKTDGTTAGTSKVTNLPGVPVKLAAAGTEIYFNMIIAGDLSVWRSDGTSGGTRQLRGGFDYLAEQFTAAEGKVFFSVDDGLHGQELWKSDGTPQGTVLVKDITEGTDDGLILGLRAVNSSLLFVALSYPEGLRLWRTDGTQAGTQSVGGPPASGEVGSVVGAAVLFGAGYNGDYELWRSDGTSSGTTLVKDVSAAGPSHPHLFVEHRGTAYFSAVTTTGGQQALFRSDGTPAGTVQMAVIPPGITRALGGAREDIYFLANGAIWRADRALGNAAKVFELTSANDIFAWFRLAPGGLYFSVYRTEPAGDTTSLWFVPADDPSGDDDSDGVPNGLESAEGLNAQVKDNDVFTRSRLFAMQQYRDFLGREGDAGGIDFHVQNLDNAVTTREQVMEGFLGSPEFQGGLPQCTRLYFSFFMRIPDYGGLMFQVGQYRAGAPLQAIAQNFSASPEFTDRYGALSNEQYIDLVYQNVLGRAPEAGGHQYYLDRLNDGRLTRGLMMIGFSESPEFQQIVENEVYVTAVYTGMLRRAPDPAGMDFYVNQIESGAPRNGIIAGFLHSPEYRLRFMP